MEEAVNAVTKVGHVIVSVSDLSGGINQAITSQRATTDIITQRVDDMAGKTKRIITSISGASDSAQKADTLAGTISKVSEDLTQQTKHLRHTIDTFLSKVQQNSAAE